MKKTQLIIFFVILFFSLAGKAQAGLGGIGGGGFDPSDPDNPSPPPCPSATISINEIYDPRSSIGQFITLVNSTPCDERYLTAFFVGNNTAYDISTQRDWWEAQIVSKEQWEEGVPWGTSLDQSTADIPLTFEDIFGADALQALYYYSSPPTGFTLPADEIWIGPDAIDDRFFFKALSPDSRYIAFDQNDEIFNLGSTNAVPEPASISLLALGIVGIGIMRRKKT